MKPLSLTAVLSIAFIAGGCIWNITVDSTVPVEPHAVEKLPLKVGVHYSPAFRAYKPEFRCDRPKEKYNSGHVWIFEMGPPSVAAFDRALKSMFEKVVVVESWPPKPGAVAELDGIIVPEFVSADLPQPPACFDTQNQAKIAYGISLYTPSGKKTASWEIHAEINRPPMRYLASEIVEDTVRRAAANFIVDFTGRLAERGLIAPRQIPEPDIAGTKGRRPSPAGVVFIDDEANIQGCVASALKDANSSRRVLPWLTFRDMLFPWLDRIDPNDDQALAGVLKNPIVRRRIADAGVRYLARVAGGTQMVEDSGFPGGIPPTLVGYQSGTRSTHISAAVFDLELARQAGTSATTESGTAALLWLGLPIPLIPATESTACRRVAEALDKAMVKTPVPSEGRDQ